jgi:hypothetical protein
MTTEKRIQILSRLDFERQTIVYPGVTRSTDAGVIWDVSADGKSCEIAYSSCGAGELDDVIRRQIWLAREGRYPLEWKVYGHDQPENLGERLVAAGFEAGEKEAFLVLRADTASLERFGDLARTDVRRVTGQEGLRDYQVIREEVRGKSCAEEIERYRVMLSEHPKNMSLYVAYSDGEPAACGRVYFHEGSRFAGLYGGSTRERFRKRGLFTQLVAARVREALDREVIYICVDALPTSEPILRRRGFESVTYTRPFTFSGYE